MHSVEAVSPNRKHAILRLVLTGIAALCLPLVLIEPFFPPGEYAASADDQQGQRYLKESNDPEQDTVVPVGDYAFPRSESRLDGTTAGGSSDSSKDYGRVLLYVTSHFSTKHEMYLKYCWGNLLARSPLLRGADVAVLLNPNEEGRRKPAMELLEDVFADQDLKVYLRSATEELKGMRVAKNKMDNVKRAGAAMAMNEAVTKDYFKGYDWVVRVNPDVLIRDDSFFRESMVDPELLGLFINCHEQEGSFARKRQPIHLHTDVFAVRPRVFANGPVPTRLYMNSAEMTFTHWMKSLGVLDKESETHKWIPAADPADGKACRAGYKRAYHDTPILHDHVLYLDICTVPEADMLDVKRAFKRKVK